MAHPLLEMAATLRDALGKVEPGAFTPADCAAVAEALAVTEKVCGAARLLFAARAVDAGAHRDRGVADGAAWLATHGGTTAHAARDALKTAAELDAHPDTKAALLAGEVSIDQAGEITRALAEVPADEGALLDVARRGDLSEVRDAARVARQRAMDPGDLHRRQQQARHLRHWRDALGMVRVSGALPPETGIPLLSRVERLAARLRREAAEAGTDPEPFDAHAADALVALGRGSAEGEPPSRGAHRVDLVVVCDLFAFRRGHAHRAEPCHLVGGGPVPVDVVKDFAADAFVKAVLHDGVTIHSVAHFGRHLPAELRTALALGPVPEFPGPSCADCKRRYGLELDHVEPLAHGGPTAYANLEHRCVPCHQAKTERDRRAGLLRRAPP